MTSHAEPVRARKKVLSLSCPKQPVAKVVTAFGARGTFTTDCQRAGERFRLEVTRIGPGQPESRRRLIMLAT